MIANTAFTILLYTSGVLISFCVFAVVCVGMSVFCWFRLVAFQNLFIFHILIFHIFDCSLLTYFNHYKFITSTANQKAFRGSPHHQGCIPYLFSKLWIFGHSCTILCNLATSIHTFIL